MKKNTFNSENEVIDKIASYAIESMLYEVSATPKPGLVDRDNSGAHKDMDFFTFMSSVASLHSSFDAMLRLGIVHRDEPINDLLPYLRREGLIAEKRMFDMTTAVNTHKGMIFTLGLLCGVIGYSLGKYELTADKMTSLVSDMCIGLCEREFSNLDKKETLTKGERMFLEHGYTGARGEAEHGYPMVKISLNVYRKLREDGINVNDALVQTLLHLIAETLDTNIISRHDMDTAIYARDMAHTAISQGGILTEDGRKFISDMDKAFIDRYISPGGCADLLAVTHFLYCIESDERLNQITT